MAKRIINVGSSPNAKDGDIVRDAFIKVNQNFNELFDFLTFEFDGGSSTTIFDTDDSITGGAASTIFDNNLTIDGGGA
jgi:hypothetical protein